MLSFSFLNNVTENDVYNRFSVGPIIFSSGDLLAETELPSPIRCQMCIKYSNVGLVV